MSNTRRFDEWVLRLEEDGVLTAAIEKAYTISRACYGSPRIYAELRSQGYSCSRKRVARLMREGGWCARSKRSRPRTTRQDPAHQKAANILNQEFEATAPNQKWVTDVTAVWTESRLVVPCWCPRSLFPISRGLGNGSHSG